MASRPRKTRRGERLTELTDAMARLTEKPLEIRIHLPYPDNVEVEFVTVRVGVTTDGNPLIVKQTRPKQ